MPEQSPAQQKRKLSDLAPASDPTIESYRTWLQLVLQEQASDSSPKCTQHGRRLSVGTRHMVEALITTCDIVNQEPDTSTRDKFQQALRFGCDQLRRRLDTEAHNSELLLRLDELYTDCFLVRYRDYAANYLTALRVQLLGKDNVPRPAASKFAARPREPPTCSNSADDSIKASVDVNPNTLRLQSELSSIPAQTRTFFKTAVWTKIEDVLQAEDTLRAVQPSTPTPMNDLVKVLSQMLGNADASGTRALVRLYAHRNRFAHSPLSELVSERKWPDLAALIGRDLQFLRHEGKTIQAIRPYIPAALFAVNAYKRKHFAELTFTDSWDAEIMRPKLDEIKKGVRAPRKEKTQEEKDSLRAKRAQKSSVVLDDDVDEEGGFSGLFE